MNAIYVNGEIYKQNQINFGNGIGKRHILIRKKKELYAWQKKSLWIFFVCLFCYSFYFFLESFTGK